MKVALIGLGKMGSYHLKALLEKNITVETCDTIYNEQYSDINTKIFDKVIIATPTDTHFEIARHFLLTGLDTFVEKPICDSSNEAARLLRIAKRNNAQLMVGHIENFNPVIPPLIDFLKESPPALITTIRKGFAARVKEYNPIRDLMIHDIGIVIKLLGREGIVKYVNNEKYRANVLVDYEGIHVVHKVNMLSNTTKRNILITREDGSILDVDLLAKKINNYAYQGDALRLQLDAFLKGHCNNILATHALELCEAIENVE